MPKKKSKISRVMQQERIIEQEEKNIEAKEQDIKRLEQESLAEIKKLESLEKKVSREVTVHPLLKITYHDLIRSSIGSLFGIMGHFSFFYGVEIGETISMLRATSLYIISFIVVVAFMYYSGFRKVKEIRVIRFIPLRAMVVYATALIVIVLVLFIFGFIDMSSHINQIYNVVSTISLLGVLGAATADIIGKE